MMKLMGVLWSLHSWLLVNFANFEFASLNFNLHSADLQQPNLEWGTEQPPRRVLVVCNWSHHAFVIQR